MGRQVLQGRRTAAHGDEVHDPALLPDLPGDLREQTGLLEQVPELGPKDPGEGFFGHEVVGSGRSPRVAVRVQPAPGDQIVDMRVIAQVPSPALQDADQAEGASDVCGIGSQLLQGLLGGPEEQVVQELLVATG